MSPKEFARQAVTLLEAQLGHRKLRVIDRGIYPGMGAWVTAEAQGVQVRLTMEYGRDFYAEIGVARSDEWHYVPRVLSLLESKPLTHGAVYIGTEFEFLKSVCEHLAGEFDRVRTLFDKDHVVDTRDRLAAIRQQGLQPVLDAFERNKQGDNG